MEVGDKIIPRPLGRAFAGDDHIIDAGTGTLGQFGTRKRTKTPSRPVAAHGVAGLFRSCEAKPPVIAAGGRGLQDKACRHRFDAAVSCRQETGARRDADQSGHRGVIRRSGRQARTALCPARAQNAAAANSCHARPETVTALANENTRLVGAFHDDAPSTLNWLSETGWGCRAEAAYCQCLIGLASNRPRRLGVIDIADDGPGIPREHWDSLFLAFRSKQRGGTGLGLAIARDLAVAQGGALKLTRSTEDGSEFRLQLPMEMFTSGR